MNQHFETQEGVTQSVWEAMVRLRSKPLAAALIEQMDLNRYTALEPNAANTGKFMTELCEMAWKAGFLDALEAIETGTVVITPRSNN